MLLLPHFSCHFPAFPHVFPYISWDDTIIQKCCSSLSAVAASDVAYNPVACIHGLGHIHRLSKNRTCYSCSCALCMSLLFPFLLRRTNSRFQRSSGRSNGSIASCIVPHIRRHAVLQGLIFFTVIPIELRELISLCFHHPRCDKRLCRNRHRAVSSNVHDVSRRIVQLVLKDSPVRRALVQVFASITVIHICKSPSRISRCTYQKLCPCPSPSWTEPKSASDSN